LKPLGGGRKGGSFLDITATHPNYPTLRINTVDVYKSGLPTLRELNNASRIRTQIAPGEHLMLIPKRKKIMKNKQMMFFAIIEDVEKAILDIESIIEVQYYKTGLLDIKSIPTYKSVFDTPNIGFTFSGDWNRIDNYLITKKSTTVNVREVPQRTGEMKYAVDQMNNPKSIEMKLGGIYQEKGNIIVAGRIATISEDADSNQLYKLFTTKIKKELKKIGAFYVGKKAEEKLKLGWRLVTNEKSPKEYDLAIG